MKNVHPIMAIALAAIAPKAQEEAPKRKEPPYPFCHQAETCIAAGRCERRVKGERWSCAD